MNKPTYYQIKKSVEWCHKYKLEISDNINLTNMSFYHH